MSGWRIRKVCGINFAEAGSGPVIMLCHGGAGSHTHWVRNIDALAAHFTVRAVDLPGYGESAPIDKSYTARQYVDAVVPKIITLISDVDRFHLVGFSFGGALSAGIAAALGERVEKLTLIAPGGFGDPVGRKLDMRRLPEGNLDVAKVRETVRHNLLEMMIADEANIDAKTLALQLANSRRTRFNSAKLSLSDLTPDHVRKATADIQLIWGAEDTLAHPSPEARAAVLKDIRPEIPVYLVPGGGHWVAYECAETVNELLLGFHAS
ncbi:MAG: alpha/beta fold hydrolase [Pseudomonadota bacterium]|nr:alpha/beta fold hydrolase [Pseudomonadota bacterium]